MRDRISISAGELNICVFPLCLLIGEAESSQGKHGSCIMLGFLKWSISIYIWGRN